MADLQVLIEGDPGGAPHANHSRHEPVNLERFARIFDATDELCSAIVRPREAL